MTMMTTRMVTLKAQKVGLRRKLEKETRRNKVNSKPRLSEKRKTTTSTTTTTTTRSLLTRRRARTIDHRHSSPRAMLSHHLSLLLIICFFVFWLCPALFSSCGFSLPFHFVVGSFFFSPNQYSTLLCLVFPLAFHVVAYFVDLSIVAFLLYPYTHSYSAPVIPPLVAKKKSFLPSTIVHGRDPSRSTSRVFLAFCAKFLGTRSCRAEILTRDLGLLSSLPPYFYPTLLRQRPSAIRDVWFASDTRPDRSEPGVP